MSPVLGAGHLVRFCRPPSRRPGCAIWTGASRRSAERAQGRPLQLSETLEKIDGNQPKGPTQKMSAPASAQQPQCLGTGDGLGTPFDAQLAVDVPGMSLDRVQGDEQALADLLVRTATRNQLQYRQLASAEFLGERFRLDLRQVGQIGRASGRERVQAAGGVGESPR